MTEPQGFSNRYRAAFETYLAERSEAALGAAYELGRSAVAEGLGLLDLADAHHAVLSGALTRDGREGVAEAAADFFRESLATFEVAHRGYVEASETARLEAAHAERQHRLADAAMALNATLDTGQLLRVLADQARAVTGARCTLVRHLTDPDAEPVDVVAPAGVDPGAEPPSAAQPLVRRGGEPVGSVMVWTGGELDATARAALVQLAQMASTALENAHRYSRERDIATTLQRSLLPPDLPDIPGLETAARFWSAGEGIQVGGDFYDIFQTGDGDWSFVIGDVCGKGPNAAALTALSRYTIRAAALHESSPARILEAVNAAMIDQRRDARFATAVLGRIRLGGDAARLTIACAGHPLPFLVRADGTVTAVGRGGTLLGIVPDLDVADVEVELAPQDALVAYTDGVIEIRRRGKELFGVEDLAALLGRCGGLEADALAARVEEQVLRRSGGVPADDVALLALRVRPR